MVFCFFCLSNGSQADADPIGEPSNSMLEESNGSQAEVEPVGERGAVIKNEPGLAQGKAKAKKRSRTQMIHDLLDDGGEDGESGKNEKESGNHAPQSLV